MYEVITTIGDDADDTVVEVKGFKGRGCHALTEGLERALGQVTESVNTAEYEEKEEARVEQRRAERRN
jgi:hypothetical protein